MYMSKLGFILSVGDPVGNTTVLLKEFFKGEKKYPRGETYRLVGIGRIEKNGEEKIIFYFKENGLLNFLRRDILELDAEHLIFNPKKHEYDFKDKEHSLLEDGFQPLTCYLTGQAMFKPGEEEWTVWIPPKIFELPQHMQIS